MRDSGRTRRAASLRLLAAPLGLVLVPTIAAGTALAHGGGIGAAGRSSLRLPTWLVLLTGGAAVGASFLLSSFVTDRTLIRAIDGWRRRLPDPRGVDRVIGFILGVCGLLAVVGVGLFGPVAGANLAVLLVWVGWWAGFTMSTYVVGNSWPALNPWRHVAASLPSLDRAYPERLGTWPAVGGLLGLVYVEVVSPLAGDAALLALVVLAYSLVTLAGAVLVGQSTWFRHADPVANVFRWYGRLAPVGRDEDGDLELRLPSVALTRAGWDDAPGDVAFVVALVWVTTYDGLVATVGWADVAGPLVAAGIPGDGLYLLVLLGGYGLFLGGFALAARASRALADTYLSRETLLAVVAPSLVAIAAGYHLAHYLGYFLTYAPGLVAVALAPLETTSVASLPILALPSWFEVVGMAAVLGGHLLAIWVAHSRAFAAIPDRMAAIRSQVPFVAVMVAYTMTSLWIVAQPEVPVPYT
jgi:hypothetical protein